MQPLPAQHEPPREDLRRITDWLAPIDAIPHRHGWSSRTAIRFDATIPIPTVDFHGMASEPALDAFRRVMARFDELESAAIRFVTGRGLHSVGGRARIWRVITDELSKEKYAAWDITAFSDFGYVDVALPQGQRAGRYDPWKGRFEPVVAQPEEPSAAVEAVARRLAADAEQRGREDERRRTEAELAKARRLAADAEQRARDEVTRRTAAEQHARHQAEAHARAERERGTQEAQAARARASAEAVEAARTRAAAEAAEAARTRATASAAGRAAAEARAKAAEGRLRELQGRALQATGRPWTLAWVGGSTVLVLALALGFVTSRSAVLSDAPTAEKPAPAEPPPVVSPVPSRPAEIPATSRPAAKPSQARAASVAEPARAEPDGPARSTAPSRVSQQAVARAPVAAEALSAAVKAAPPAHAPPAGASAPVTAGAPAAAVEAAPPLQTIRFLSADASWRAFLEEQAEARPGTCGVERRDGRDVLLATGTAPLPAGATAAARASAIRVAELDARRLAVAFDTTRVRVGSEGTSAQVEGVLQGGRVVGIWIAPDGTALHVALAVPR